jgi:hypothetical protein
MGLVQAPAESLSTARPSMEIEGVRITWERDIDALTARYGTLIIDHSRGIFGSSFIVGYDGAMC